MSDKIRRSPAEIHADVKRQIENMYGNANTYEEMTTIALGIAFGKAKEENVKEENRETDEYPAVDTDDNETRAKV